RKLVAWVGREDAPLLLRPAVLPSLLGWGLRFLQNSGLDRFRHNLAVNARLARYSLEKLRGLRAEAAFEYSNAAVGTMKFYRDPDWFGTCGWMVRQFEQAGVRLEVLDAAGVVAREPALEPVADRIAGGLYFPDDESGDAHQFCQALAALAAAEGVEFRYGVEVRRLVCRGDDVEWLETGAGRIDADAFVLAAGSY